MTTLTLNASALPVYSVDGLGNVAGPSTTPLAASIASLASGATTPVVGIKQSGGYLFAYVFGGTAPSLKLQSLAIDGATWNDVVTVTASGQQFINIAAGAGGAAFRLLNSGTGAITGLTAALVS